MKPSEHLAASLLVVYAIILTFIS